jgi:hypothetical protein
MLLLIKAISNKLYSGGDHGSKLATKKAEYPPFNHPVDIRKAIYTTHGMT